ncbi:MAG: hypothetical protein JWQ72_1046, partial [Polaromonas sp.]|nr:hypothetical protein [Polaromonas sp.]
TFMPSASARRLSLRSCALALVLLSSLLSSCASRIAQDAELADDDVPARGGTLGPAVGVTGTAWAAMSVVSLRPAQKPDDLTWEIFRVPGKESTHYSYAIHDGRDAVLATAEATGGILRHRQRVEPAELGRLSFSWKVPLTGSEVNKSLPTLEDVPVRVVLAFEGDRSRFSFKNNLLNELSLLLTGEELPFATLVYAWSRVNKPGDVVMNDRTDRIRKLIVDAGDQGYNQWQNYERDVRADYRKVFGEEPGALLSYAVFTEGERNEGRLQAWYGPVSLQSAGPASK